MSDHCGYAGKVIKIDLCRETVSEYPWNDQDRERYLGGKTMAARILCDHLTGQERAFSEESCIVITTGPLTGTGAPGSARFDIASLSPKDDLPVFSNCGGDFGLWLKKAGYDAVILTGRCKEKRWLEICDDKITFHDAQNLWGTGTASCQEKLTQLHGTDQFGRLCIGPAGENLVKFASVIGNGHAAGRAGIGAVLGYKNLKAITVSGSKTVSVYDPDAAAICRSEWYAYMRHQAYPQAEGHDKSVCPGCPLHCAKHLHVEKESILNELGMDVIAAEAAAAWAAEQGISTQGLYEDIAYGRGTGRELAEGVSSRKGKDGKRRGGSSGVIAEAFHLPKDDSETELFCRRLTEATSAAGLCIFTLNALRSPTEALPTLHVLRMLSLTTGMEMDLEKFLQIGEHFLKLEQQLRSRQK